MLSATTALAVVFRGAAGSLFLNLANAALTVAVSIVLARGMGIAGYGIFAFVTSTTLLLLVPAILGADRLVTREVAVHASRSSLELMRGLVRHINQLVIVVSVGLGAITAAVVLLAHGMVVDDFVLSFWIGAFTLPRLAVARVSQATLMGLGRVVSAQVPELLARPTALLVLVVVAVSFGALSPPAALAFQLATAGLGLVLSVLLLRSAFPPGYASVAPAYRRGEWTISTLELALLSGAAVINAQTGTFLLGVLRGPEDAGLYAVAARGAMLISFGLTAVNTALAPTAARLWANGEVDRLQQVVTASARAVVLFSLPVALIFILFAGTVLEVAFGAEFRPASQALAVLSAGQLVNGAMGSVGTLLIMTGNQRLAAAGIGAGACLNIVLCVVLIPILGVLGAALAATASITVWNILLATAAYRRLGVRSFAIGGPRRHRASRPTPPDATP
jgi:O-antigen/teichoic acid export membrane protein